MYESGILNEAEFAVNPEPRCPCVLLLDTSSSMSGYPISQLNDGLCAFKRSLMEDDVAQKRVEIAIVTFDSQVNVVQDFVTADNFEPPALEARGLTHMGEGILRALDMVRQRKETYNKNDILYYRPWVFMVTDGEPQGEPASAVQAATRRIHEDEAARHVAFFAVGVDSADMGKLSQIVSPDRQPVKLKGLNFADMFVWLSRSMQTVSNSNVNTPDTAQDPLSPLGWAVAPR